MVKCFFIFFSIFFKKTKKKKKKCTINQIWNAPVIGLFWYDSSQFPSFQNCRCLWCCHCISLAWLNHTIAIIADWLADRSVSQSDVDGLAEFFMRHEISLDTLHWFLWQNISSKLFMRLWENKISYYHHFSSHVSIHVCMLCTYMLLGHVCD